MLDSVRHHCPVSAIIGLGRFGTVPLLCHSFLTVSTLYVHFLSSVHRGISLEIICFIIIETIMQILSQGSINYLLFVTSKCEKTK